MSTNVIPFDRNSKTLPAHIAKFVEENSNIDPRNTVPQLSFRGKVWRTVINGEENALLKDDDEPVSIVHVVVLDHNKARSRSFYEGAYDASKAQAPACWSSDGETPDTSVPHPQAKTCAACPNSVKGSKITPNGKESTACSVFKRVAVVPLSDLSSTPMLLRLAQTSMWDKNNEENEAKGWYAWDQYLDMLRSRGATHTGIVATKIRFDSRVEYPKLLFAASRWLADEELDIVRPLCKSEDVKALLKAPESSVAMRTPKVEDTEDDEAPPAVKPGKPAKAAPPPADDEDEDIPTPAVKAPKKAAPVDEDEDEAPPPPKAKKAAPPPADEDEDEAPPPPKAKKAKAVEGEVVTPPAKANGKPPAKGKGLADLIGEWNE
jgi:hypothetical protein